MRLDFFDYIGRQDKSFKEKPFTKGDAVVFSTIANLDLSDIYTKHDSKFLPLSLLAEEYVHNNKNPRNQDVRMMQLISHSKRYGDVLVSDVVSEIDKGNDKQFGGIVFYPQPDQAYVGFAGTGSSVIGYKEDLNMSYMDVVPSQQDAVNYLNTVGESLPENVYVGGFSKGGNLAVFASAFSKPEVRQKIKHVYNHDGPGFSNLILQEDKYKTLLPIVTSYVPKGSMVGLMLNREEEFSIIESTAPPIAQHLPYTWIFDDDDLLKIDNLSSISNYLLRFQDNLLNNVSEEKRRDLIEAAFSILMAVEPDDFQNFVDKKMELAPAFRKSWKEADKKTKKNVLNLFKTLGSTAIKSIDPKKKKKKKKKKG